MLLTPMSKSTYTGNVLLLSLPANQLFCTCITLLQHAF